MSKRKPLRFYLFFRMVSFLFFYKSYTLVCVCWCSLHSNFARIGFGTHHFHLLGQVFSMVHTFFPQQSLQPHPHNNITKSLRPCESRNCFAVYIAGKGLVLFLWLYNLFQQERFNIAFFPFHEFAVHIWVTAHISLALIIICSL